MCWALEVFTTCSAQNVAKGQAVAMSSVVGGSQGKCVDGNYNGWTGGVCETNSEVNPWIQITLPKAIRVRTVVVLNDEVADEGGLIGSEVRVGGATSPSNANPSCGVVINEGGIYECNLFGNIVTLRRTTATSNVFKVAEISIWPQTNVANKGVTTEVSAKQPGYCLYGACASQPLNGALAVTPFPLVTRVGRGTDMWLMYSDTSATNPWFTLDLGLDDVPIHSALFIGRSKYLTYNKDYWIYVGNDVTPMSNESCNTAALTTTDGVEQACNLNGRYVHVVRQVSSSWMVMPKLAVFPDCDAPNFLWDFFSEIQIKQALGETVEQVIPLASALEGALGVGVCGALEVQFINLPPFCTISADLLSCTPDLELHRNFLAEFGTLHIVDVI